MTFSCYSLHTHDFPFVSWLLQLYDCDFLDFRLVIGVICAIFIAYHVDCSRFPYTEKGAHCTEGNGSVVDCMEINKIYKQRPHQLCSLVSMPTVGRTKRLLNQFLQWMRIAVRRSLLFYAANEGNEDFDIHSKLMAAFDAVEFMEPKMPAEWNGMNRFSLRFHFVRSQHDNSVPSIVGVPWQLVFGYRL